MQPDFGGARGCNAEAFGSSRLGCRRRRSGRRTLYVHLLIKHIQILLGVLLTTSARSAWCAAAARFRFGRGMRAGVLLPGVMGEGGNDGPTSGRLFFAAQP